MKEPMKFVQAVSCAVLGAGVAFAEPSVEITKVKLADARDGTVEYAYTVGGDFEGWNYDLIVKVSADEGTGYARTFILTFDNVTVGSATKVVNIKELCGFASPCVSIFMSLKKAGSQLWAGGPIFAECNIGATKPEEYGGLYENSGDRAEAAARQLGNKWRLPTKEEFEALIGNCDRVWTEQNGVKGCRFTGKGDYSSRSIFLPAAGYSESVGWNREKDGVEGCYWSSRTFYIISDPYADNLCFDEGRVTVDYKDARFGMPVRAVRDVE